MHLSIIIVSYNVKYFLEQCLCSVQAAIGSIEAEVWVVDNASTDGTVDYLAKLFPGVHFIVNKVNMGFGKANNEALSRCKGDLVLFLNPDTLIPEDCFVNCIDYFGSKPDAGAIGIRMIDGRGIFLPESKRSFPTPASAFYKLTGLSALFPRSRLFSKYNLGFTDPAKSQQVEVLSGAFFMVRRQIVQALNGFDELFFMYGEDIDLSYRIQALGYRNYYFAGSTIIHFKGESATASGRHVRMFYDAMSRFVEKHYKARSAGVFTAILHGAIWVRAAVAAVARAGRFKRSIIRGSTEQRRVLLVGQDEDFASVSDLIRASGCGKDITGRIRVNQDPDFPLPLQPDLDVAIASNTADQIVFCGSVGYKNMVAITERIGGRISCRFHGTGSHSIVGSDLRIGRGNV